MRASHGQTSPKEIPPRLVRVAGQIAARPSIRAPHREEMWTDRVEPSSLDSLSRKSVMRSCYSHRQKRKGSRDIPTMFPGRESAPKYTELDFNALLRF